MKKITIRDVTIEFEETLDLEITEDKIVVKGKQEAYPFYVPYPNYPPVYPPNPWITWTLPNYVPSTGVLYQSSLELQNYQGLSPLDNGYQDCSQEASYQSRQQAFNQGYSNQL